MTDDRNANLPDDTDIADDTDVPEAPDLAVATSVGMLERPPLLEEAMGGDEIDEEGTSLWKGALQRLVRNPSAIVWNVSAPHKLLP